MSALSAMSVYPIAPRERSLKVHLTLSPPAFAPNAETAPKYAPLTAVNSIQNQTNLIKGNS